ncbi:hypothetical protein ACET66_06625 [Aeromonas simiae]|uniref:hypothetical protein n=1 Tax=Aeromonas simiae TaxID=218936 RepID=UPI0038D00F2D
MPIVLALFFFPSLVMLSSPTGIDQQNAWSFEHLVVDSLSTKRFSRVSNLLKVIVIVKSSD